MRQQNPQSAIRTLVQAWRLVHLCQDIARHDGHGYAGAEQKHIIREITDQMQQIRGVELLMHTTALELLGGKHV